jgi:membrane-bound lytic murein transglycosylase A
MYRSGVAIFVFSIAAIIGVYILLQDKITEYTSSKVILQEVRFDDLKGFTQADLTPALKAFQKTCSRLAETGLNNQLLELCDRGPGADFRQFLLNNFTPYRVHGMFKSTGLFTGYYIPELHGSYKKTERFKYAVYGVPTDEEALTYSREDIESGKLHGKAEELLYVDDDVMLYFTQIQGSGKVALPDGTKITIGYAGKNKQRYHAIGKYFIENEIYTRAELSAEKIIEWLRANPEKKDEVLNLNPSYVFFRLLEKEPITSSGVEVTAEGTLAVDKRYTPLHSLVWLEGTEADSHLDKLFVAQDTGGAIKGVIRGDVFFGDGEPAFIKASTMKEKGKMYILLPKNK